MANIPLYTLHLLHPFTCGWTFKLLPYFGYCKGQDEHACECAQSQPALWDPIDCSPPGSSVHGILQARILEWVAVSFSRGSSPPRDRPSSLGLLHWQVDSLPRHPLGSPHDECRGVDIFFNEYFHVL